MSISDPEERPNDFENWLVAEFASTGSFTALVVLVSIGDTEVSPLCSTYFNVIGDEVEWNELVVMFAGAGQKWDGAAFWPVTAPDGGPLDNPTARLGLHALEARLDENRLVLNEGKFFDAWGRRMMIEEMTAQ